MSNDNTSKAPAYIAYAVKEGRNGSKGFWTRIGAVWPHKDDKGYDLQLECVPLDGRVQLRIASENK